MELIMIITGIALIVFLVMDQFVHHKVDFLQTHKKADAWFKVIGKIDTIVLAIGLPVSLLIMKSLLVTILVAVNVFFAFYSIRIENIRFPPEWLRYLAVLWLSYLLITGNLP